MRRRIAWLLVALTACGAPSPAEAYLKFGVRVGDRTVDVKWGAMPIRFHITERDGPGVSAAQLREAVTRAFATWQAASASAVRAEFQAFTIAPPGAPDGRSTIGFLDRPDLERVLGATSFLLDATTGQIVEADIYFNTRFDWSTSAQGVPGRVDLESVALHEVGHLLGLGHSAVGETEFTTGGARRVLGSGAVMFPIALTTGSTADRVLQADDIAAIADLYAIGNGSFGSVSGRVTRDGRGVPGAHVTAFNTRTGALVGGFSLNAAGEFAIAGLEPGVYILRAEPLDDADPESFFAGAIADSAFAVTYLPRTVVAPRGGASDPVEIRVRGR